jgi:hypothetical protein
LKLSFNSNAQTIKDRLDSNMNGLIGRKVGMTQYYNAEGNVIPVTVIETGPCVVVQKKETAKDGYNAVQVGFGTKKAQRVNKAMQGHMAKAGKGEMIALGDSVWWGWITEKRAAGTDNALLLRWLLEPTKGK